MVSYPTYDANLFSRGITDAQFKKLLDEPEQAAHQPRHRRHPAAGLHLQARDRHRRRWPTRSSRPPRRSLSKPYVQLGADEVLGVEPRRAGARSTSTTASATRATRSSTSWPTRLGIDRLAYWARQFGFGEPTGIDLPERGRRPRPDRTSGRWTPTASRSTRGEVLQAGIGQGYDLATVLQVANAYAAIANGGKLYQPQVVREIRGPRTATVVRPFEPKLIRKIKAPASVLTTMRKAARRVVTSRPHVQPRRPPDRRGRQDGHRRVRDPRQERSAPLQPLVRRLRPKNACAR